MYIVDKIIDKCEKSSRDWRSGVSGRRTMRIESEDYDKCGKSALISEVKELEFRGLIEIEKWVTRGSDVDIIAFRVEKLDRFYELAKSEGRMVWPKQERVDYYRGMLEAELGKGIEKNWIREYYRYLISRLDQGIFPKGVEKLELYTCCLRGIDELKEPVYKRVFSKKYLKSSKKFEKEVQSHLISIAKKYCDEIEEDMDDKSVLSQLLVEEYAQELEIKGPLRLVIESEDEIQPKNGTEMEGGMLPDQEIDMSVFIYGVTLNSAMLKYSRIVPKQPNIRRIITIENKANFVSMPYDPHTLYIFSHGYFSPKERKFLQKLAYILSKEDVEYYHSGDLDYGGIKIYEYIKKRIFPELRPYLMDEETYDRYLEYGEEAPESVLKKIKTVELPEFQGVIDRILETGLMIEQESFLI